jgi:hypothetical protein
MNIEKLFNNIHYFFETVGKATLEKLGLNQLKKIA